MADFKDQSGSYRTWVQELLRVTRLVNPSCRHSTGIGMLRYVLNAAFLLGIFLLLVVVMFLMWTSIPAIAIAKMILIACYIPILFKWFHRNKPGSYDPTKLPVNVMP